MSDEPTPPSNLSPRQRPRLIDLSKQTTEDDLWDLDDELDSDNPASKIVPEPRVGRAVEGPPPEKKPHPLGPSDAGARETSSEASTPSILPQPAEADVAGPVEKGLPETTRTSESGSDTRPAPVRPPRAKPAQSLIPKPSRKEWIWLGGLAAILMGIAIWWLLSLLADITTTRLGDDRPSMPVEGRYGKIREIRSYWRQPNRDGENADFARLDILYIPVVEVTIAGNGTGVFRAIFRDSKGEFIGDSISHGFSVGRFDKNQSSTVEFAATSGFREQSDFNAYQVGGERWTIEILEGPSLDAPGSEFTSLCTAPISSFQR